MTCAVCGREWSSRNARAQHERRAHPDWSAPAALAAARRVEVEADSLKRHPGADRNRRYRERHPDRVLATEATYRAGNREAGRARSRAYRQSERGREVNRAIRHRQIVAGKHNARMAVQRALERGDLVRQPCRGCGTTPAEAHHHLGYEREHWLDVVWLCDIHHSDAHHPEAAELRQQLAS